MFETPIKLGIIGTAGRGTDKDKLTKTHWKLMLLVSQSVMVLTGANTLISGGAAWSDHLAVYTFLKNPDIPLELYLPAGFCAGEYLDSKEASTSNYYHGECSNVLGFNTLDQIDKAILHDNCSVVIRHGFHIRNTDIANNSDILLSFTFGDGPDLKDGGTENTMNKFLSTHENNPLKKAYHFDLNSMQLYRKK